VAAGAAALAARSVLLGAPLGSGRYRISLTDALSLPADDGSAAERAAIMASLQPPSADAKPQALLPTGLPPPAPPARCGQRPDLHDAATLAADGPDAALRRVAAYAMLAPSPHNTQPWLFRADHRGLTIAADQARALPVADPAGRARAISLGCSAMSALVAAAAAGLGPVLEIGDWQVLIRLGDAGEGANPLLAGLFPALAARVTDKRGYPPDQVDPPDLPLPDGIVVHYLAEPEARQQIGRLHRQAVAELAATTAFGRELAGWLRADPADPRRDGMALPLPPAAAASVIKALGAGPVLGLLTCAAPGPQSWIRAGLAWQRLALTAHLDGLATAPLTAVAENAVTCQAATALVAPGQHLLMLFRLGKSPGPLAPTARRDPAWLL
jgi:nitroreductase